MTEFGLDIASRPPVPGGILATAATSAKAPYERFTQRKGEADLQEYASESDMFKTMLGAQADVLAAEAEGRINLDFVDCSCFCMFCFICSSIFENICLILSSNVDSSIENASLVRSLASPGFFSAKETKITKIFFVLSRGVFLSDPELPMSSIIFCSQKSTNPS